MSDIEQEAHWLDRNQDYWQARAEAAERESEAMERELEKFSALAVAAERDAEEHLRRQVATEATLTAVREWAEECLEVDDRYTRTAARTVLAILDGTKNERH